MSNRKELFDRFLTAGFLRVNKNDPAFTAHERMFQNNYDQFLPQDKDARILEIGFGMGQFLKYILRKKYTQVRGVEVSEEMYAYASQHVDPAHLTLIDSQENFLSGATASVDCIVMNDVIEHIEKENIVPTLKLIRAALKPGGTLIVKTNNVAAATGARMRYEDFTHEWSFTPYSLRQVLTVAGFTDIQLLPFRFPVTSVQRLLRWCIQKIFHALWRLVYWIERTTQPEIVHEFMFAVAKKEQ